VFVIAGIIGIARMISGAHNIAQITAGFLLGIVSALVLFTLAG
jgi:membrane-associated phospholipid phosphatase